jgi:hypothetical protein
MEKAQTYIGGAYRTSARFGDRVELTIDEQNVTITGPRIGRVIYHLWIDVITLLIAAVPVFLIIALIKMDWLYAIIAAGAFLAHYVVAAGGAGTMWSLASFMGASSGQYPTVTFPVSAVKRVGTGKEWARGGLRWIIPQFAPLIDKGSLGHCISFEAPEGKKDKNVTYAIFFPSEDDIKTIARLLRTET